MRIILILTFILKTLVTHEPCLIGTYKSSLDFPRHPMELTLKLKKNKKYRLERSSTTVHPRSKVTGIFEIRNDSIILYPMYYKIEKHSVNQYKKEKFRCEYMRDFSPCDANVLLITNEDSSTTKLMDRKRDIEWILENE